MSSARFLYTLFIIALVVVVEFAAQQVLSSRQGYLSLRKVLLDSANSDEFPRLSAHPYLNYFPTPGFSIDGVEQHNIQGYRGPAVNLYRTENVVRILFLGGSTTYSYGVNNPDSTLPEQIRSILPLKCPNRYGQRLEVINAGLPSGTSAELLTHYLFKYRYYNPDIVVIHTGGNDAIGNALGSPYQPDLSHFRKTFVNPAPPPKIVRWLLYSRTMSVFIIKLFYPEYTSYNEHFGHSGEDLPCKWYYKDSLPQETKNHDAFYNNIRTLVREIHNDGARVLLVPFIVNEEYVRSEWLGFGEEYLAGIASNRSLLMDISLEDDATFCDFRRSDISDPLYFHDDCHLTATGTSEKARVVGRCLCSSFEPMNEVPSRRINSD